MKWNDHSKLEGMHAYLSASKYHWLNYDEDKLIQTYINFLAVQRGTKLHEFAAQCIELGQKLPKSNKTLNLYVNDAIGYKMRPEQLLFYSEYCFGTADAIRFDEKQSLLRIHDLKTGVTPAHMEQLYIYDALFCLEYHIKPRDIEFINQIYQSNEIFVAQPSAEDIEEIINTIISSDRIIRQINEQEA